MRKRLLSGLAKQISTHPWRVGLILLLISLVFAALAEQLTFTTSVTNLMPQDDPMIVEFNKVMEEYAGAASMLVVVEGRPDKLVEFADRVTPKIEAQTEYVKKVDYKLPREFLENHALMLMKSKDLENNRTLFENPNLVEFVRNLNDSFEKEYTGSGGGSIEGQEQERGVIKFMDGIQSFVDITDRVLSGDASADAGTRAADAVLYGDLYYRSWDREMLIMQIIPTFSFLDIEKDVAATNLIEGLVKDEAKEVGVQAGLTGSIPLSRDEMESIENDSFLITGLALIGILVLFIVAFRMAVSPVLAIITLMIGVLWAMGLAWVLVQQLNLMTSMMAVVLVGLGIDFSIHIIAVYTEARQRGESIADALKETLHKAGMGIMTGGFTTAAAFLTMVISRTEGMREFGLVLGVGIIMTMLAALTVLPTLLVIYENIWGKIRPKRKVRAPRNISYGFLGKTATWLAGHRATGIALVIVVLLIFGYRGSQITMDYNYLNMEPEGLESIELQDRMIETLDISSDYAYITASTLDEAYRITEEAKDLSTSGMVQSIVDFLPPEKEQHKRRELVQTIRSTMEKQTINPTFSTSDYQRLVEEIARLEMNVIEIQDMSVLSGQDKVYKTGLLVGVIPEEVDPTLQSLQSKLSKKVADIQSGSLTHLREKMEGKADQYRAAIESFAQEFAMHFKPTVISMANPESITLKELPGSIRRQFVGESGDSYLISVFPKDNVWDISFLERFTQDVISLSPRATGLPPVFKRLMDFIAQDGRRATGLAIVVIFLLLFVDFRSAGKAILAIVPLIVGAIWMLGTMEMVGMQLTMLNIMAIPLIIGIGIDDGVHAIHRYQIEGTDNHYRVFSSTGRAILLTSLTTMLGFGSLTFATYRGLGSMGSALFIGVGVCFLATLAVLPLLVKNKK